MQIAMEPGETILIKSGERVFAVTSVTDGLQQTQGLSIRSEAWLGGVYGYRPLVSGGYYVGERVYVREDMSATMFDPTEVKGES